MAFNDTWEADDGTQWPTGPTFESFTPNIWRDLAPRLADRDLVPVASDEDRNRIFGVNPGGSRFPRCIYPDASIKAWDGKQWLTYDTRPAPFQPAWYSGTADDPSAQVGLSIGNGVLSGWMVRAGHTVTWEIILIRGDNGSTHTGAGQYSWWVPFKIASTTAAGSWVPSVSGLSARISTSVGYRSGLVTFRSSNSPVIHLGDGSRLSSSSFSWGKGDSIVLGGTSRIGGLL